MKRGKCLFSTVIILFILVTVVSPMAGETNPVTGKSQAASGKTGQDPAGFGAGVPAQRDPATPVGSDTNWFGVTFPSGHYYSFYQIQTPYGVGQHIDTVGTSDYNYTFMGCTTANYTVDSSGSIQVTGWFRQYDILPPDALDHRVLDIYVLDAGTLAHILNQHILNGTDGTGWVYKNVTVDGLTPGVTVKIGFGMGKWWTADWQLTREWVMLSNASNGTVVSGNASWTGTTNPGGYHYNLYQVPTPYGQGCHIDSAGSSSVPAQGGYDFFAFSNVSYPVGSDGGIEVRGYFRQSDIFDSFTMPGRREVRIFIMYSNDNATIVKQLPVISYTYGTGWVHREVMVTGLSPGSLVKIGVGRHDGWSTDWQLTAEWAAIEVVGNVSWSNMTGSGPQVTSPVGNYCNFYPIITPYGPGHHIDTNGSGGNPNNYAFYGCTLADYPVGNDGSLEVKGHFRQDDSLAPLLFPQRRLLWVFIMYSGDNYTIVREQIVLNYTDGTGWLYRDITINGLTPGSFVRIGFGRYNCWSTDYKLVVEWAGVEISSPTWGPFGAGGGGGGGGGLGGPDFTPNLVLIIASGGTLITVLGILVVVSRRRAGASHRENAPQRDLRMRIEPQETRAVLVPPSMRCPSCGGAIEPPDSAYCVHCGTKLQAPAAGNVTARQSETSSTLKGCMICGMQIKGSDIAVRCPYCGNRAHRIHMLEWLHVKDYCPVCQRHLDEQEFGE
ncbi:MAG: hypothetical protein WED04_11320 [Promethearchaeati archaeon SRVP18_Atabeyarchaeia-1]